MTDINSLLNPESYEILWDYCLEIGIAAPSFAPVNLYIHAGDMSSEVADGPYSKSDNSRRSVMMTTHERSNTGGSYVIRPDNGISSTSKSSHYVHSRRFHDRDR